jgi:hypothetical protein
MKMFDNMVVRGILVPNTEKVKRSLEKNCIMRSFIVCTFYKLLLGS